MFIVRTLLFVSITSVDLEFARRTVQLGRGDATVRCPNKGCPVKDQNTPSGMHARTAYIQFAFTRCSQCGPTVFCTQTWTRAKLWCQLGRWRSAVVCQNFTARRSVLNLKWCPFITPSHPPPAPPTKSSHRLAKFCRTQQTGCLRTISNRQKTRSI